MADNVFCNGVALVHESIALKKMIRRGVKYLNAKTVAGTDFWYEAEKVIVAKEIIGNLGLERKYGKNWRELAQKAGYLLYSGGNAHVEAAFYIPKK